MKRWGFVFMALSCCPPALSAQVSLQVVNSVGTPLPSVRVEVYGRGELLSVASTGADGIVTLDAEQWVQVRRLSLSFIGFQTLIVHADELPVGGIVQLEPLGTEIPGLTVSVPDLCPNGDDPEARRIWAEVAARYATDTGSRAMSARYQTAGAPTTQTSLRDLPDLEWQGYAFGASAGARHSVRQPDLTVDEQIAREGYAWPAISIGSISDPGPWRYPDFTRMAAHHFASTVFGELHDFEVVGEGNGETTLSFCPNGTGRGASISGMVVLIPGDALVSAQWLFHTEEPNEERAGMVEFFGYDEGPFQKPHLLAERGMTWRPVGKGPDYGVELPTTYARRVVRYSGWSVHATWGHPCKAGDGAGLTYHGDPPRDGGGVRFAQCVEEMWGRE